LLCFKFNLLDRIDVAYVYKLNEWTVMYLCCIIIILLQIFMSILCNKFEPINKHVCFFIHEFGY
jgi:hypothetical protein